MRNFFFFFSSDDVNLRFDKWLFFKARLELVVILVGLQIYMTKNYGFHLNDQFYFNEIKLKINRRDSHLHLNGEEETDTRRGVEKCVSWNV